MLLRAQVKLLRAHVKLLHMHVKGIMSAREVITCTREVITWSCEVITWAREVITCTREKYYVCIWSYYVRKKIFSPCPRRASVLDKLPYSKVVIMLGNPTCYERKMTHPVLQHWYPNQQNGPVQYSETSHGGGQSGFILKQTVHCTSIGAIYHEVMVNKIY